MPLIEPNDVGIDLLHNQYPVDSDIYETAKKYSWWLTNGYLETSIKGNRTYLHRYVFGLTKESKEHVDHINGNKLDNRRCNLRKCTRNQNLQNSQHRGGTSEFKGVSFQKTLGKWHSYITVNNKRINIGWYPCERKAALLYNRFAKYHFKEFANLNEVPPCL